jgi:lipase
VGRVQLYATEWGDPVGPPVVCLHGVLAHAGRFRKLAEERLAGYRVVALDLRGHGHSEWEPPWDLPTHVEDLRETVAELGVERATWIGHSFGGRLVMELIARAPELVERAVLLDPAIWVPPPIALERAEGMRAERTFGSAEEAVDARFAAGGLFHTPRELVEEEVRAHLVAGDDGLFRYRYSQSAVVAAYGEMAKSPPPFELLRVPTLLVRGEQTDVVPEVLAETYREGVGEQVDVLTVPGGHVLLWDAFTETADAIEAFLA